MGRLLIIISAIGFSLTGVWTGLLSDTGLSIVQITFVRLGLTSLFSAIILLLARQKIKLSDSQMKAVCLLGPFGSLFTLLLYSLATSYISVGLACLLNFSYPLVVVALSYIFFKEKISKSKMLAAALMLTGLALVSGGGTLNLTGLLLGVGSALSFAIYIISQERSSMCEAGPLQIVFYSSLVGCLVLFIYLMFSGSWQSFDLKAFGIIAIAAIASNIIPMYCLSKGVQSGVPSSQVGFICIIEPALALIWDRLIFNVALSGLALLGVIIIFCSFFVTIKTD